MDVTARGPSDAATKIVPTRADAAGGGSRRRERPTTRKRLRRLRAPDDRTGETLGGTYRIERKIAAGGMGEVYLVRHLRLDQPFAVKFLDRRFARDQEAYARFRREAEIAAGLDHPAIVQVVDFNTDAYGHPYMVMEYVEGQTLDTFIEREAPFDRRTTLAIFEPLCHALDVAHRHGIVHRDIKPSNIIVRRDRRRIAVKLLDFGISKIKRAAGKGATREHVVMGTPNYMSPEQARGHTTQADARADVFALGAILYECLSGRKAFDGEELPKILHAIAYEPHRPLSQVAPKVPAAVCRVVDRCLAKEPSDRFPSTRILYRALVSAYDLDAEEQRVLERSGEPPRRDGLPRGGLVLAVAAAALVSAAGGFLAGRRQASSAAGVLPAPMHQEPPPRPSEPAPAPPPPPQAAAGFDLSRGGRLQAFDRGAVYVDGPHVVRNGPGGRRSVTLRGKTEATVTAADVSPDGRWIAAGYADGTLVVARLDGYPPAIFRRRVGWAGRMRAVALAGPYVAVAAGRRVSIFPRRLGRPKTSVPIAATHLAGALLPRPVLFAAGEGHLAVIDPAAGRVLARLPLPGQLVRLGSDPTAAGGSGRIHATFDQGDVWVTRTYDLHDDGGRTAPTLVEVATSLAPAAGADQ